MKQGLTELVFILDKSGSMSGLETDTIGGYNAMLAKQQAVEGECHITTVLFDHTYELLHDRIDIKAVGPITEREYFIGGSTALLDAIGRTIHKIANAQRHTADDYRAETVMMTNITVSAPISTPSRQPAASASPLTAPRTITPTAKASNSTSAS
jgi:uncharacterized protein YegL